MVAETAFIRLAYFVILVTASSAVGIHSPYAQAVEDAESRVQPKKITIGAVEEIILSPWDIRFPARIDTGADLSSLDARELVVREDNVAEFRLGRRFGSIRLQLPVVEWRQVKTSIGTEKRPVVEISICLGSKLFPTLATLKDRSQMIYPFLVGRSALSDSFLVDPSRFKAVQPACPGSSLSSQVKAQSKE